MLAFPALWIGWLALSPARRQVLIRPATWVVLLGSLLALLPPILWNANEGWVTFEHTASHFKSSEWDPLRAAGWLLSFAGSQAFLWGPVLSFAAIRLLVSSKRGNLTEEKGFLLTFSLPLALVLWHCGKTCCQTGQRCSGLVCWWSRRRQSSPAHGDGFSGATVF